jgi:hypothetical protein
MSEVFAARLVCKNRRKSPGPPPTLYLHAAHCLPVHTTHSFTHSSPLSHSSSCERVFQVGSPLEVVCRARGWPPQTRPRLRHGGKGLGRKRVLLLRVPLGGSRTETGEAPRRGRPEFTAHGSRRGYARATSISLRVRVPRSRVGAKI